MIKDYTRSDARVLIYSHDTFGLGHLRRCRTIAHSLVGAYKNLSVLILSGSPIIGSFDFRIRTDFVRIPGVIKLHDGDYTPLKLHMDINDTLHLRESLIRATAEDFDPDLFIVDKEPLGLRGEVASTLELLKRKGAGLVLGVRDILDDDTVIKAEWEHKNAVAAVEEYYDAMWIYGVPEMARPLDVFDLSPAARARIQYTGYLERTVWSGQPQVAPELLGTDDPYILVTPGGGGDGVELMDWVLRTYEADVVDQKLMTAVMVLGPFMASESKTDLMQRAADVPHVVMIDFNNRMEDLMVGASGVVAMGGYNTFCEVLSFDKPAVLVPRTKPRLEQYIRAKQAQDMGLVCMLEDDGVRPAEKMHDVLSRLPDQKPPSAAGIKGLLDGEQALIDLAATWVMAAERVPEEVGPYLAESAE